MTVFLLLPPLAAQPEPLLATGSFATEATPPVPEYPRLVSYNLHGPPTKRIEPIAELLGKHPVLSQASVFCLQEVNRDHEGSGNKDVGLLLARRLEMHYAYAVEIEHENGGGVRGLAILSRFPLENVERVQLPVEGPGGRRRIALGATVLLGEKRLRVWTTHLETRITPEERREQIGGLIQAADGWYLPTIILGDFNTLSKDHTDVMREMMREAGFRCPLPGNEKTFQAYFFVRLKLDWIWMRRVKAVRAEVESDIDLSDHRPIWVDLDW